MAVTFVLDWKMALMFLAQNLIHLYFAFLFMILCGVFLLGLVQTLLCSGYSTMALPLFGFTQKLSNEVDIVEHRKMRPSVCSAFTLKLEPVLLFRTQRMGTGMLRVIVFGYTTAVLVIRSLPHWSHGPYRSLRMTVAFQDVVFTICYWFQRTGI